jgi:hypothetical protein
MAVKDWGKSLWPLLVQIWHTGHTLNHHYKRDWSTAWTSFHWSDWVTEAVKLLQLVKPALNKYNSPSWSSELSAENDRSCYCRLVLVKPRTVMVLDEKWLSWKLSDIQSTADLSISSKCLTGFYEQLTWDEYCQDHKWERSVDGAERKMWQCHNQKMFLV